MNEDNPRGSMLSGTQRVNGYTPYATARISSQVMQQAERPFEGATPAARGPHVAEELDLLRNSVSEMSNFVDALWQRLERVIDIRPSPAGEADAAADDLYRVPLADDLRTERRRLQYQVARLSELLNCVEL